MIYEIRDVDVGISIPPHAVRELSLALQLPFCFEVRPLSCGLVSSTPE